jgi:hypothetical protein
MGKGKGREGNGMDEKAEEGKGDQIGWMGARTW